MGNRGTPLDAARLLDVPMEAEQEGGDPEERLPDWPRGDEGVLEKLLLASGTLCDGRPEAPE
eukprot:15454544-Alexandrium_andersonii.AAC.1